MEVVSRTEWLPLSSLANGLPRLYDYSKFLVLGRCDIVEHDSSVSHFLCPSIAFREYNPAIDYGEISVENVSNEVRDHYGRRSTPQMTKLYVHLLNEYSPAPSAT